MTDRPVILNCAKHVGRVQTKRSRKHLRLLAVMASRTPTGGQWMAGTKDKAGHALRRSDGSRAPASGVKAPIRKSAQLAGKPTRAGKSALRRGAIVAAALVEFSARVVVGARRGGQ